MALIVQKYGGTSVGSVERIKVVAQRVQQTVKNGDRAVVVVSAMGKTTDNLVRLAQEISANPSRREMDMLLSTGEQVSISLMSMALQELGVSAISLTGAQVGIVTEAEHSRARILQIRTDRLDRQLERNQVVVVAGFQGIDASREWEITTLGRGGSDTSAVAIAAALGAQYCEIYTDVPGILTTDPRLVPQARCLEEITCDEMLELASLGAKVLHPRAVEIARNYGVTLVVRSSWTDEPGTRVLPPTPKPRSLEGLEIAKAVDGVQFDVTQARVSLMRLPDAPGVAARLFGEIARQGVDVNLIIQSVHEGNTNDIAFTVKRQDLPQAEAVAAAIAPVLGGNSSAEIAVEPEIATVAITGAGTHGRPGIAAQMFAALARNQVNIRMISTSEVKIECAIDSADSDRAVAAICQVFEISSSPIHRHGNGSSNSISRAPAVRGVALDENQARIAVLKVPDIPGRAARILDCLAREKIAVDTIVQSQRCHIIDGMPARDLAFTVRQEEGREAIAALEAIAPELGYRSVLLEDCVAKVSVVGAGMQGQPGVAARLFSALAREQINIESIATSEIKISCVVARDRGIDALRAIHRAFHLESSPAVASEIS